MSSRSSSLRAVIRRDGLPWVRDGRSCYFVQQNRGKRSICVDFTRPESWDLLRRIAAEVDVVIENFGTGVLERRGLDYRSLSQQIPGLIMASISAFGREGPWSHKTGFDQVAQALSGVMALTGETDGPPVFAGAPIGDCSAGMQAWGAIGYALWQRERTGRGQWIDVTLVDSLFHMHAISLQAAANSDGAYVNERWGRQSPVLAPVGAFRGPDGYVVIMALNQQWGGLCRAMGRPELESDPRFDTVEARLAHQAELTALIEEWLCSFESNAAACVLLDEQRVPNAPVIDPARRCGPPVPPVPTQCAEGDRPQAR